MKSKQKSGKFKQKKIQEIQTNKSLLSAQKITKFKTGEIQTKSGKSKYKICEIQTIKK
jgi:hypothetical protein